MRITEQGNKGVQNWVGEVDPLSLEQLKIEFCKRILSSLILSPLFSQSFL
jgi:hypothetical protein